MRCVCSPQAGPGAAKNQSASPDPAPLGGKGRQRRNSVAGAFGGTQQSTHMAELLEMTGATDISSAVKFQVAAMKTANQATLVSTLKEIKQEQLQRAPSIGRPQTVAGTAGGLAAVLAAKKLKRHLTVRPPLLSLALPCCPVFAAFTTVSSPCLLRAWPSSCVCAPPTERIRLASSAIGS